ncbi:kinase-like protein [Exidia glandulosa HHB12029]|uniref:Kinase-like protein n=1 Tax=Exidia glandulosa HHB12029 TaxID=1314781 RepID=A0A165HDP3_EXIGL|nr:kinase-like protein [Exidia glandulosa HHB12029]
MSEPPSTDTNVNPVNDCRAAEGSLPLNEYLEVHPTADRSVLLQQVAILLALHHKVDRTIYGAVKLSSVQVSQGGRVQLIPTKSTIPITSLPRAPARPDERLPMTTATDVYAFAWLVFHTYTDIDPQELARNPDMIRLIASGVKPNRPGPETLPSLRGLDDTIWNMCLRCWEISPIARPQITEVIHAFDTPRACSVDAPPCHAVDAIVGSRITVDSSDAGEKVHVVVEGPETVVAVKILRASAMINKNALQQTATKLQQMHHPNVLPLCGTTEIHSSPVLVSPWVTNGNLKQYLAKNPEANRLSLMLDVLSGLTFIHEKLGIVHGAVASDNVLISEESKAVLTGVGMPAVIDTPTEDNTPEGPIPPERSHTSRCPATRAMDMWAYGALVLESLIGRFPAFSALGRPIHPGPQSDAVKRGLDERVWDICEKCLDPDPSVRPDARTVMENI